jgi:hypothetical protein
VKPGGTAIAYSRIAPGALRPGRFSLRRGCKSRLIWWEVLEGRKEFFRVPLFKEAKAIDLMWHTFLLFTGDNQKFCQENFVFFIHHARRPLQERRAWQERIKNFPEEARLERKESLRQIYSYINFYKSPVIKG